MRVDILSLLRTADTIHALDGAVNLRLAVQSTEALWEIFQAIWQQVHTSR